MSYIFTQTFKSNKAPVHSVCVHRNDDDARAYAEQLLDSSVDVVTVTVSKQIGFVEKVESKVWQ